MKANREYEEAETLYQRGLNALKNASQTATQRAESMMSKLEPTLALFEGHAQTRLGAAMRLMNAPEFAEKIADVEALRSEANRLRVVFNELGEVFIPLRELRRKNEALRAAWQARREPSLASAAQARVAQLEPELKQILKELTTRLDQVAYPFHHARTGMTLEGFVQSETAADLQLGALYNNGARHVNQLSAVYQRVLGRLSFIALKVEDAIPACMSQRNEGQGNLTGAEMRAGE